METEQAKHAGAQPLNVEREEECPRNGPLDSHDSSQSGNLDLAASLSAGAGQNT